MTDRPQEVSAGDRTGSAAAPAVSGGAPAGVPAPPATSDARVDAALGELASAVRAPVGEHVEAYASVQRALHDRLADLDG